MGWQGCWNLSHNLPWHLLPVGKHSRKSVICFYSPLVFRMVIFLHKPVDGVTLHYLPLECLCVVIMRVNGNWNLHYCTFFSAHKMQVFFLSYYDVFEISIFDIIVYWPCFVSKETWKHKPSSFSDNAGILQYSNNQMILTYSTVLWAMITKTPAHRSVSVCPSRGSM